MKIIYTLLALLTVTMAAFAAQSSGVNQATTQPTTTQPTASTTRPDARERLKQACIHYLFAVARADRAQRDGVKGGIYLRLERDRVDAVKRVSAAASEYDESTKGRQVEGTDEVRAEEAVLRYYCAMLGEVETVSEAAKLQQKVITDFVEGSLTAQEFTAYSGVFELHAQKAEKIADIVLTDKSR